MKILKTNLYSKYRNRVYFNVESKMISARHAARYIGRYLARPSIAEYRILEYDGKKLSGPLEKKSKENTLLVIQFIGRLIKHIPREIF